jgi:hypothetical protein
MGRPRLSPEEREARRKARSKHSFSDAAYQHYDPAVEGFGSEEQWEATAKKLFGDRFVPGSGRATINRNKWLLALGLDEMPETLDNLKKAFRAAMFRNHPDYGGTNAAARDTMEAFEVLRMRFE